MSKKSTLKNPVFLSIMCLLFSFNIVSQQPYNKGGYWITYLGDNNINDKLGIHTEGQLRNNGINHGQATNFFRLGLNIYTSKTSMVTGGYGFFYVSPSREHVPGNTFRENRVWEQYLMRKKTNFVFMEHRYRLEQRFIENVTLNESKVDHRIRYRFQAILPFYNISPYLRYFFFAAYNEVMLNFRRESNDIYDRNRLYFALGIQVSPKLNFQVGYLNQLAVQPLHPNLEVSHLFQLGLSFNMDDLMRSFFIPTKSKE